MRKFSWAEGNAHQRCLSQGLCCTMYPWQEGAPAWNQTRHTAQLSSLGELFHHLKFKKTTPVFFCKTY